MKIAVRRGRLARPTAELKPFAILALAVTWAVLAFGCLEDAGAGGEKLEDPSPDEKMAVDTGKAEADTKVDPGTDPLAALHDAGVNPFDLGAVLDAGWAATSPPLFVPDAAFASAAAPYLPDSGAHRDAASEFGPNASATKLAKGSPEFAACYLDYVACNAFAATRDCVVKGAEVGCLPEALVVCVDRTEACSPNTGLGPGINGTCTQVMGKCLCEIYPDTPDVACDDLPIDTSNLPPSLQWP